MSVYDQFLSETHREAADLSCNHIFLLLRNIWINNAPFYLSLSLCLSRSYFYTNNLNTFYRRRHTRTLQQCHKEKLA